MSKPVPVKFSEFPHVNSLPRKLRIRATVAMEDAIAYKQMIASYEKDLEVAIQELESIQKEIAIPGMQIEVNGKRWGFAYQQVAGRRQLSKVALMEKLGISKKDLDRCMVQGKEGERRTLKEIKGDEGVEEASSEDE